MSIASDTAYDAAHAAWAEARRELLEAADRVAHIARGRVERGRLVIDGYLLESIENYARLDGAEKAAFEVLRAVPTEAVPA